MAIHSPSRPATPSLNLQGIYIEWRNNTSEVLFGCQLHGVQLYCSPRRTTPLPRGIALGGFLCTGTPGLQEWRTLCLTSDFSIFSIFFRGPQKEPLRVAYLHSSHFFLPFSFRVLGGGGVFGITELVSSRPELEPWCIWLQSLRTRMDAKQQCG